MGDSISICIWFEYGGRKTCLLIIILSIVNLLHFLFRSVSIFLTSSLHTWLTVFLTLEYIKIEHLLLFVTMIYSMQMVNYIEKYSFFFMLHHFMFQLFTHCYYICSLLHLQLNGDNPDFFRYRSSFRHCGIHVDEPDRDGIRHDNGTRTR